MFINKFSSTLLVWLLSSFFFGLFGCDDEPKNSEIYELSFALPEEGSTLGCVDDLNRVTLDEIDIAVSISATVPEGERDDLIVELSVSPERFSPQRRTLTEGGRVIFEDLALTEGEYVFTATLLNGSAERTSEILNVNVVIDEDSPLCGVSQSALSFLSPSEGAVFIANDDLDSDLTNGLQIPVEVEVQGPLVSVGGQVEVQVNGNERFQAQVENGVARFESVTLPLSGTPQLRAIATGPNGLLEAVVNVSVAASACGLTLSPLPMEGCDIGSTADVDPERQGLQAELTATTSCESVIWTVNGQTYPAVDAIDGVARYVVTLNNGENTVSAKAQSSNGLSAEVPTYVLDVDLTDPELDIDQFNEIGVNRRTRDDAIDSLNASGEEVLKWRVSGFSSDLAPNTTVRLEIIPPLEGAPSELSVDSEGRFTIELEGDYLCGHQLTVSSDDLCGGVHNSPSYSFCFDGVTPRLSIVEPENLSLINVDEDEATEGLQTSLTLRVDDARESEDYPIEIQCTRGVGGTAEVLSLSPVLKSTLSPLEGEEGVLTGSIVVSFPRADRYACKPIAMTGQNEPILATSLFRVITDEPIFEILDPTIVPSASGRDYACFSNTLFIGGQGSQFSLEDTQLNFTLYNEAGQAARFGRLQDRGNGFYNTSLDLSDQQLADGRYTLEISGVSGSVEVSVIPSEPIELLIDNAAPIVGPLAPANGVLTLANDENSDLTDCIQSSVEFSLSDESAERVCFSLNGGSSSCVTQFDQGVVRAPSYDFLPGDNILNMEVIDCTGAMSSFDFTLRAEGCFAPLRVSNFSDGGGVTLLNDMNSEQEGIQLTLSLTGDPDEVVSVEVSASGFDPITFGPVTLDRLGLGELSVTVPSASFPVDFVLSPISETRTGQRLSLTSYAIIPSLTVRPFDEFSDCLNLAVKDRSSAEGFQLHLVVDAEGLSDRSVPQVKSYCGAPGSGQRSLIDQKSGSVVNLGQSALITFTALTLADGECDLELSAIDVNGSMITQTVNLLVDRTPPEIGLLLPNTDEPLNLLVDNDLEAAGIQFPVQLNVCGAAGQNLTVSTDPPQAEGEQSVNVSEGVCQIIEFEEFTFINGDQILSAQVIDACGNAQLLEQNIVGNTGVSVVIVEPNNQELIGVNQDLDPDLEGCQIEINVFSTGFNSLENVEFALCASNQAGPLSPLCGNQTDISQGSCVANDDQGANIACLVTLTDAEHELSIVARENGVDLRSAPISIRSDCTAPTIVSIEIAEDLNADQCINAQERANSSSAGTSATFNVDFEVTGIPDGGMVTLRTLPGQRSLGLAEVTEGRGSLSNLTLTPGEYSLYLSGLDLVNNSFPTIDSDHFISTPLLIDTQAPSPELLQPSAGQCINIEDDLEAQPGAQYRPIASTGSVDGEPVALTLSVDGIIVQRETSSNEEYTFSTILLMEGAHQLALISEDLCGNTGSAAGFDTAQGRPNWNAPRSIPISVDLTAPTIVLNGVSDGQVLSSNEDANQSPADGFQVNISIAVTGLEPGQELQVYSGEERLPTLPVRLLVPAAGGQQSINTTLTLPPGIHPLSARAADLCNNNARSTTSTITIDVEGCSSQITSLVSDQLFGPQQGTVTADGKLRLDISGQVDLLDPECANAQAELLLNGSELLGSTTIDPITGIIVFNEISIPEGVHGLSTRVRLNNEETYSLGKTIRVDLSAPSEIEIISPALNELGVGTFLQDSNTEVAGQQMTIVALITESPITSNRIARVSIDGIQLPSEIPVPHPSTGNQVQLRITGINPPPREATYQLCITDEANNERCETFNIIADPAAPTGITFTANVINKRSTEVDFSFTAPGDDQSGGDRVVAYEARWSFASNPIETQLAWDSANQLDDFVPTVQPGAAELITSTDLPPNKLLSVSIRARDDVGRLGPIRSGLVNTRLSTTEISFISRNGDWASSTTNTAGNPLKSIGDFNGDGIDDLLVNFAQPNSIGDALVMFGNTSPSLIEANSIQLNVPSSMTSGFFGVEAASVGDVNGDGAVDLIIGGYTTSYSGSAFALYFGCPALQICNSAELATADSVIITTGTLRSAVAGAGDFMNRLGLGFDDIVIGGGIEFPGSYSDPQAVFVIEGRQDWPEVIEASAPSLANGIYGFGTPSYANTGVHISSAGDLDGDGSSEFLFTAGGSLDHVFLVYGGQTTTLAVQMASGLLNYTGTNADFIELSNPCTQLSNSVDTYDAGFGTLLRGGVDLNGDNQPDFVIGNSSNKLLIVMDHQLNKLDCFRRGEDLLGYRFDIVGDINGDGALDLIVANNDNTPSNLEKVFVFYNNGSGIFGANELENGRAFSFEATNPLGVKLAASAAGDINDDGQDDFAVLSYEGDLLTVTIYY